MGREVGWEVGREVGRGRGYGIIGLGGRGAAGFASIILSGSFYSSFISLVTHYL